MSFTEIEGVLLTGGASKRMGRDKGSLTVSGVPIAERIAQEIAAVCEPVTVIGNQEVVGFRFVLDDRLYEGPLYALSRFHPEKERTFVASCDMPQFQSEVVAELARHMGDADVAAPLLGGRIQPLCAIYRSSRLVSCRKHIELGERRLMEWVATLKVAAVELSDPKLEKMIRSANTPEEWDALANADD